MLKDLQSGLRQAARNKVFSAIVVLLLALGIGANALIFSFVETLLLKPLPVKHPKNLYMLEQNFEQQVRPDTYFNYRQFIELSKRRDLFSAAVAEQAVGEYNLLPLGESNHVRLIMPQIVSPNYFSELDIKAALGRVLNESDAQASSPIPVVLSYQFWESQFNRNLAVIGQVIRLKNVPFTIVGVLPREFHSIDIERAPDVRLPIAAAPALIGHPVETFNGWGTGFAMLVRLIPSVAPGQAAAAINFPMQRFQDWNLRQLNPLRPHPWTKKELEDAISDIYRSRAAFEPIGRGISQLRDQFSQALELLMGAVVLLFLGVCANVAGLLLAKSEERRREIAVRLSVGASRARILRQLLSENLLLAIPGALLGFAFAYALSPFLVQLLPAARSLDQFVSPRILTVSPDARVLLITAALSVLSVIIFGIAPAFRGTRLDLHSELKGASRNASQAITGITPIAVQIALSVILLSAAALMVRTFWNLEHLNPGFDRAHIVSITLSPGMDGYWEKQTSIFLHELKDAVSSIPGVRSAAYARLGIMRGAGMKATVAPKGVVLPPGTFLNSSLNGVSPTYFEAMGIPLLAGRSLADSDRGKQPVPTIINRALADLLFPHQDPIGKYFVDDRDGTKPPTGVVVGVVGTAKYRSLREQDPPTWYELFYEDTIDPLVLYVRTFRDPERIVNSVRNLLHKLGPGVPVMELETLEQEVQNSLWQERLVALLSAFFGLAAIALAALGLYGALSYSVARRTRELGIRLAVGAQLRHIVHTVCGRMAWSVGFGLAGGLLASVFVLGITRRLLYGVEPLDGASFFAAIGAILLLATFAAALPSRRAAKSDPSLALRDE